MTQLRHALAAVLCLTSCLGANGAEVGVSLRDAMRDFVIALAAQARSQTPGFLIVPQNGLELLTMDGRPDGILVADYVAALDGVGQEDVSFGYTADEVPTPSEDRNRLLAFLDRVRAEGLGVSSSTPAKLRRTFRRPPMPAGTTASLATRRRAGTWTSLRRTLSSHFSKATTAWHLSRRPGTFSTSRIRSASPVDAHLSPQWRQRTTT
jgi:hypothetical protein